MCGLWAALREDGVGLPVAHIPYGMEGSAVLYCTVCAGEIRADMQLRFTRQIPCMYAIAL